MKRLKSAWVALLAFFRAFAWWDGSRREKPNKKKAGEPIFFTGGMMQVPVDSAMAQALRDHPFNAARRDEDLAFMSYESWKNWKNLKPELERRAFEARQIQLLAQQRGNGYFSVRRLDWSPGPGDVVDLEIHVTHTPEIIFRQGALLWVPGDDQWLYVLSVNGARLTVRPCESRWSVRLGFSRRLLYVAPNSQLQGFPFGSTPVGSSLSSKAKVVEPTPSSFDGPRIEPVFVYEPYTNPLSPFNTSDTPSFGGFGGGDTGGGGASGSWSDNTNTDSGSSGSYDAGSSIGNLGSDSISGSSSSDYSSGGSDFSSSSDSGGGGFSSD
jgi:hypothetical protein